MKHTFQPHYPFLLHIQPSSSSFTFIPHLHQNQYKTKTENPNPQSNTKSSSLICPNQPHPNITERWCHRRVGALNEGRVLTVVALGAHVKEVWVTPEKREGEGRASWVLDVDVVSPKVSSTSYGGVASSRSGLAMEVRRRSTAEKERAKSNGVIDFGLGRPWWIVTSDVDLVALDIGEGAAVGEKRERF